MKDVMCGLAGLPGLEPRLTESESAVLPLDDSPTSVYSTIKAFEKQVIFSLDI